MTGAEMTRAETSGPHGVRPRPRTTPGWRHTGAGPGRPGGRALAAALGVAALGQLVVPVVVPGAAPPAAAAAEPCRTQTTGVDMDDIPGAVGAYPLIDRLGLRHAWDLADGDGVTVAVIDSGVDADHPDLADSVERGSEFIRALDETEFTPSTPPPELDCVGHGTAVAGLIAGRRADGDRIAGVAPGATIYPVRMADGVDQATQNTLAAAIRDAVANDADIINLSLAVASDHDAIREAIADAVAADVLVVAATGNEGNENVTGGRMYPAAYDGVLAVGAVDANGEPLDSSNFGPWVDLAAYGDDMVVVAPDGEGYRVEGGTSMAAAQVSGAAALLMSRFDDLSAAEVARRLIGSASLASGEVNDRTGAGIVDPFGALTHLDGEREGDPGEDEQAAVTGSIAVQTLPREEPLLSATAAAALAWSGGLLLAVVLGLLAAPGVRRAIQRGWRAGAAPPERADEPAAGAAPPVGDHLAWLGGDARAATATTTTATTPAAATAATGTAAGGPGGRPTSGPTSRAVGAATTASTSPAAHRNRTP
ncbi:S8 family serine peptidase [Streptomyces sp. B6B3]|uniref:S8 family serine peptidase n=1 Tax=Streptomyces sp. B6B3 TaxID=3153570 RepID=UPI00325EB3D6